MEELWKDVKGYEGLYLISNLGKVKTLPRKVKSALRSDFRIISEKIHKPCDNGRGYKYVCFRVNGGKGKHRYIHRLVSESFIENPNEYLEVNHIDGNKSNNTIHNLEWCNRKQNTRHAIDNGLVRRLKGEEVPQSKLTNNDVFAIRELYPTGQYTQKRLGEMYGVSAGYIWHVITRNKWKHI